MSTKNEILEKVKAVVAEKWKILRLLVILPTMLFKGYLPKKYNETREYPLVSHRSYVN